MVTYPRSVKCPKENGSYRHESFSLRLKQAYYYRGSLSIDLYNEVHDVG